MINPLPVGPSRQRRRRQQRRRRRCVCVLCCVMMGAVVGRGGGGESGRRSGGGAAAVSASFQALWASLILTPKILKYLILQPTRISAYVGRYCRIWIQNASSGSTNLGSTGFSPDGRNAHFGLDLVPSNFSSRVLLHCRVDHRIYVLEVSV